MDSVGEGLQPARSGGADRGPGPDRPAVGARAPRPQRRGVAPGRSVDDSVRSPLRILACCLLTAVCCLAQAQNVVHDAKSLATAPAHWDKQQWTRFGEGLLLVAAVYAADPEIQRIVQRNRTHFTDEYSKNVMRLGGGAGQDITIAMIVSGWLAHDDRLRITGIEALEASVFASGIVTPAIKRIGGRARPIQNLGARSWHPLDHDYDSFPSGHSTNAWAIATVIAKRYDDSRVIPYVAYAAATSVSLARVDINVHWASDVVAGALIGRAVAHGVVGRHLTLLPSRHGVVLIWRATMTPSDGT